MNYSNYLELMDVNKEKSDNFEHEPKKKTILDQFKPDISGKQMINKTRMNVVEIKKKAVDHLFS